MSARRLLAAAALGLAVGAFVGYADLQRSTAVTYLTWTPYANPANVVIRVAGADGRTVDLWCMAIGGPGQEDGAVMLVPPDGTAPVPLPGAVCTRPAR